MAKRKEAATPEQRLQEALVPESDQPYKVPENWCWTRLGNITEVIGGGTPQSKTVEYYENGTIPWLSPADLSGYTSIYISHGAKNITELGLEKSSARLMPKNTVCLSSRAPIGYVAIAGNPVSTNQGFKSFLPSPCYKPHFLYWYLKSNKELLESYASGTTFLELSGKKAGLIEFPLPPLSEQQRIVDRIESLFAQLDEAKEKAQAALDSFDPRKAAILHKAFTGELTTQWRKEHGMGMESWENKTAEQLFEYVTSGSRGWAKYYSDSGDIFIRMGNLDHGTISLDLSDIQYISLPAKAEGQRSKLQKNDILISITADIGMIGLVGELSQDAYINQHIALARPNGSDCAEFIAWYLVSDVGLKQMQRKQRGATKIGLGLDDIRSLQLAIPTKDEQHEIVRLLDNLLAKEQQAKEAAEAVLEQIDLIKKSILSRAFRGELGTNDPTEESSIELLKEILEKEA